MFVGFVLFHPSDFTFFYSWDDNQVVWQLVVWVVFVVFKRLPQPKACYFWRRQLRTHLGAKLLLTCSCLQAVPGIFLYECINNQNGNFDWFPLHPSFNMVDFSVLIMVKIASADKWFASQMSIKPGGLWSCLNKPVITIHTFRWITSINNHS